MDIPEQILEVDGIPVRCFVSNNEVLAFILPDDRVEYWKTKMREFKESRGELNKTANTNFPRQNYG